jgi:hypothetical protein
MNTLSPVISRVDPTEPLSLRAEILTKINNSKMFIYIFVNILIKINNPKMFIDVFVNILKKISNPKIFIDIFQNILHLAMNGVRTHNCSGGRH